MLKQVETENLYVEYESKSDAFSHSLGTQKVESNEIKKIEIYIPATKDWMDVTHLSGFDQVAIELINLNGGIYGK